MPRSLDPTPYPCQAYSGHPGLELLGLGVLACLTKSHGILGNWHTCCTCQCCYHAADPKHLLVAAHILRPLEGSLPRDSKPDSSQAQRNYRPKGALAASYREPRPGERPKSVTPTELRNLEREVT